MRKSVVVPRIPGESSKDEFGRIIKYISHLWRNASDDVIDYWIALAEQEKENHAQQNPDYKYKPRHRRRNKKNRGIGEDEETRPRRGRKKRRSSSISLNVNTETAFQAAPAPSFPLNELYNHQDSNATQLISEGVFNTVYSSLQEYPNTFFSQSTSSNTRFPSPGNPFNTGEPSFEVADDSTTYPINSSLQGSSDTSSGFGIYTPISNRPLPPSVDPARISNQHQYYMGQSFFTSDISQQPYINYYTDQDFNDWLQLHTAQQPLMADGSPPSSSLSVTGKSTKLLMWSLAWETSRSPRRKLLCATCHHECESNMSIGKQPVDG
ncbi:hypothetical protein CVT25_004659 [Psilocybe cyanescens]|uniref:HMG box domain-containing protein n=1 Tax=Psilocybe cyanescens TaxID=93625 RepID=A0A409XMJ3_PSICY|nr:hypothetical protein CVT25_004659 [Psilocybe cyanescens]